MPRFYLHAAAGKGQAGRVRAILNQVEIYGLSTRIYPTPGKGRGALVIRIKGPPRGTDDHDWQVKLGALDYLGLFGH